jgi:hypothetical protein
MRTTLDVDKKLLEEAAAISGEKNLSLAVNRALAEYVRLWRLKELRRLIKQTTLEDNWREFEDLELAEQREPSE